MKVCTTPKKAKVPKQDKPQEPVSKKRIITVRPNTKPKLVDMELMKSHNFMSKTEATPAENGSFLQFMDFMERHWEPLVLPEKTHTVSHTCP